MTVLTDVRRDRNEVFSPTWHFDEGESWISSLLIVDTFEGETIDPQSLHKYLYCHADPVNNIDPMGLMVWKEIVKTSHRSGYTRYFYAPDFATATATAKNDRGTLYALSRAEQELVKHCKNNIQAEKDLADLLNARVNTGQWYNPSRGGLCGTWLNDFLATLPKRFQPNKGAVLKVTPVWFKQNKPSWISSIAAGLAKYAYKVFGGLGPIPGHFAAKIKFPDGYKVYFDNGWAGTGGIFNFTRKVIPYPEKEISDEMDLGPGMEAWWPDDSSD